MRFAIHYLTEYHYDEPVSDNLNVLRVTPASTPSQGLADFRVRVDPEARLHRHTDYFGTQVVEFGITRPHEHLTIDVRARVTTQEPPAPQGAGWAALGDPRYRTAGAEYLLPAPIDERWHPALAELEKAVRGATPAETLRALCELIPDRFEYRAGVTYVGSRVEDLLEGGAGVCQDFAHLGLALLRDLDIAARYVSGYFYAPAPDDDGDAASAEVQTHAWLEALLPGEDGAEPRWAGADPTNRRLVGPEHVKIGHGRRYDDIPPVKGVFRGGSASKMESSVRMTRADATGVAA